MQFSLTIVPSQHPFDLTKVMRSASGAHRFAGKIIRFNNSSHKCECFVGALSDTINSKKNGHQKRDKREHATNMKGPITIRIHTLVPVT
jgi:hypothetical protein